jgi:hypothetical protein
MTGDTADTWWYQRQWSSFRRGTQSIVVEWEGG